MRNRIILSLMILASFFAIYRPEYCFAKWSHPTSLAEHINPLADVNPARDPYVAMDASGEVVIVWAQPGDHEPLPWYEIFISEFRDNKWNHPNNLADSISPDGTAAIEPKVALDVNGTSIVVWSQEDNGSNNQIFKSEYRNGSWSHPSGLTDNISPDGQNAEWFHVAMNDNKEIIIVWVQSDGKNNQIFKSEYRNGSWSHPSGLADNISPDGEDASWPHVAMDINGNAIITWVQSNGTNIQVFKSEYRNKSWTHPKNLADNISPNGQNASYSFVAMNAAGGNAIITWKQSDGTNGQVFKSEYRNNAWSHPINLDDNISPDSQTASVSSVFMDGNNNAIIAWEQSDGTNGQVFKSEYRDNTWSHPNSLADNISPNGQDASWPLVAMDDDDNAIITWRQSDGTNEQVFISEYRNNIWSHPNSLADNISPDGQDVNTKENPQVSMGDGGKTIVVWSQSNGTSDQIYMSIYMQKFSWLMFIPSFTGSGQ